MEYLFHINIFNTGVITINKRSFIIILITILIGISIYLVTTSWNKEDTKNDRNTPENIETEQKEIEEDAEVDTIEDEEETITAQFREKIVEAVKSTLDFFLKRESHVVAIGDSLTKGVGDGGYGGYIGILDKTVNAEKEIAVFENFGKRGNRTDQLLKRLDDPEIITSLVDADIILITIGANDVMQVAKENFADLKYTDFSKERVLFAERLRSILNEINELNSDADIYLLGLYNPFEKYFKDIKELDTIIDDWNQTGRKITEEHDNTEFVPIKDLFDITEINLFSEDNFHPNGLGYHRMAERVLEYVTEDDDEDTDEER